MLVAAKFSEDEPISNQYWAEVSGVNMKDLNILEEDFCFGSEFNFFVEPRELKQLSQEYGLVGLDSTISRNAQRDEISTIISTHLPSL